MTEWILSSSILILIVITLRTCFKGKISLTLQYAIWGLVLLRLLIPVSFGSTDFSVANLTSKVETPAIVIQSTKPSENVQAEHTAQHPQEHPNEIPSQNITQNEPVAEENGFDLSAYSIHIVWGIGFICVACLFLFTNLRFKHKIVVSRYRLNVQKNNLDVYATGEIDTPCLFGIKNPVIYVTYPVADNQTLLRHTLEHEATHHRHGDHIWAVLRCICLAIHWYNPLVWWAAFLSQRDAELACDESTIKRLGEGERAEYGRTLIGMTCQRRANVIITATTMNASKNGLKERIMLIAKKPKMALYTLVIVILVSVIAVGCTFTGGRDNPTEQQPPVTDSTETPTTEGIETEPPTTEAIETEPSGATIILPTGTLYEQLDDAKICIAVQPTGISTSGGDYRYFIPENQEVLQQYYLAAVASAEEAISWDNDAESTGWWIVYEGEWWRVLSDGTMFGASAAVEAEDAKEFFKLCDAEVKKIGLGEPVRPEDITEIKSATLYWNGEHTVTDEYALNEIEKWLSNSQEEFSVSCWFTAQLVLELENGETKTLTMATDSCATWMSEGVVYGFGEETADGIKGNEEFYALFAPAVIRERAKEGMDAVADYWYYLDWGRYANMYGSDETFALMDQFKEFVISAPYDWNMATAIRATQGLDGAYAEYYAGILAEMFEADKSTFSRACLSMASDPDEERVLGMLAFHWNITTEEVRTKLEADIPQN